MRGRARSARPLELFRHRGGGRPPRQGGRAARARDESSRLWRLPEQLRGVGRFLELLQERVRLRVDGDLSVDVRPVERRRRWREEQLKARKAWRQLEMIVEGCVRNVSGTIEERALECESAFRSASSPCTEHARSNAAAAGESPAARFAWLRIALILGLVAVRLSVAAPRRAEC